ncbi:helix-turn-helix domain-containing protein [Proteus terrae]|uniref:helix-turn-helix domain-containing protein n=1 Tax=Proteus terrae TaxID=1574161 RepID=UPI0034E4916E
MTNMTDIKSMVRPELIELRRKMMGMSQKELASKASITQGTLSKIEQGLRPISDEQLDNLSTALDCPVTFFTQSERLYGGPISANPMFRKKASVSMKTLDKLIAEINVRIIHIRKLLQFVDFEPEYQLPFYDPEDYEGAVEGIANNVRRAWYIPRGPIKNLVDVMERAGIVIIDCDMDDTGLSGVSYNIHGLPPLVFINKNQPMDRYRFTLAHELGHLVMHKSPSPTMEVEADGFASEFLLPTNDIKRDLKDITLEKAAYLKPYWRASMGALFYKAKQTGAITPGQSDWIWRQMSARGYRTNEPIKLDVNGEEPTLLDEMFEYVKAELGYAKDELTSILNLNSWEIDALYYNKIKHGIGLRLVK